MKLGVKGSLKRNVAFWQSIGAPSEILSIIEHGYQIPFTQTPPSVNLKNNRSAFLHSDFVTQAILELLQSDRVIEISEPAYVVNPLSVSVQATGKKRLILDLRHVNQYVVKAKIKYEDWKVGLKYFQKDSFMISFDLKSGYHHIDIHKNFQTFLGFSWKCPKTNTVKHYVFTVLPFGLSSAPYVFTKCLKPLEKYWRLQDINITLFLDDGWLIEYVYEHCLALAKMIQRDLLQSGLIYNPDKSIWVPCQILEWLGLVWNSRDGCVSISERRITNILTLIEEVITNGFIISARKLASLTGKIISTNAVVGNISRLMTRHCSMSVASASYWDEHFQLDQYCINEILFWQKNLQAANVKSIDTMPAYSNYMVYSDASGSGCGAHFNLNGEQICHKLWDQHEISKSSTWRELSAIEFALSSFLPMITNTYLKWFTDSQAACRIVQVGCMHKELHEIAIRIYQLCIDNNIELAIQWIPRTQLQQADAISRIIDIDDWQITPALVLYLDSIWGKHTIDCFANYYNRKIDRFFSWHWNPGCTAVDFFVQSLRGGNCLVVPPVSLITEALNYLHKRKAIATVIIPFWPSSDYWPKILPVY